MEVLMRKIIFLSLVLILMISSSVHALSWAISFVVWKGNVYEVKQEEIIEDSEIGKVIGEVKTTPDDMTGEYYGDASNFYPKGTKYYAIKGIPTSKAIAIKNDNQYLKAVYVHKAPFHIMNVLTNIYFLTAVVIVALLIIRARVRFKKANS
jgi:hypothetical protein